ncbi:MAG TPA: hypothetical protein VHO06_02505 [Polyangia bacterium]|nr:hypothetical protein [Polyangia bacterium]
MRRLWTRHLAAALLACAGCAGASGSGGAGAAGTPAAVETPGARDANLAGARCKGGPGAPCACRHQGRDDAEAQPPDADHKRFELRLGATGGGAMLDSPTLGHFSAGADESCYYIDVLPGTTQEVTFTARAASNDGGIAPELQLAEYGPKGPWWYDILQVRCDGGPGGRCNREAAEAWGAEAKTRKRGRVDPCGSTVISHLRWDTSGGKGERDLGTFRDFTVTFSMEVKRFPTQFAPGATECVPK